ncbi:MAG: chemotaxis protein CheX [Spirochaetaceae bacterium]|nr:chemotaxis protein CheX [Spirochaetaceae bacterium]
MDQGLIGAFVRSARDTFRDMFGLEAEPTPARILGNSENHSWDITGLVGLAGQTQGVMAIRLTRAFAIALLTKSGMEAEGEAEADQMVSGIVGELSNIVAGSATSAITHIDIEISPPVVVRGKNHEICWPAIGPVVAVALSFPEGSFELDLCVKG